MNTDDGFYKCAFEILANDKLNIRLRNVDGGEEILLTNVLSDLKSVTKIILKAKNSPDSKVALVKLVTAHTPAYAIS